MLYLLVVVFEDGVGCDDDFPHESCECDHFLFPVFDEAFVEFLEGSFVASGGHSGHEEHVSDACSAASCFAISFV